MQVSFIVLSLLVTAVSGSQPEASAPAPVPSANVNPVVGNAPVVSNPGVEVPVHPAVVGGEPAHVHHVAGDIHHPGHVVGEPHHIQHGPSYYSPAGMINIVGEQGPNKPVRNFEQFGQPESAALPANYKPFGSWGLYIGGNPADGYYTDYYKQLSNSVDKQQSGEPVKPVGGQTAAFSPILKQAGSSPFAGGDYYPFAYSPADLNSVAPPSAYPQGGPVGSLHQVYASSSPAAPVSGEASPSVYGGSLSYADSYATKKLGSSYVQKEVSTKAVPAPVVPPKGYQSRQYQYQYAYQPAPLAAPPAPVHHQPHVVAYPVPVGSQIVGSQPGVEGAYGPYGVHAFTRYAVKPTVVNHEPSYYYSVHGQAQFPAYKQQVHSSQPPSSNYPLSFYGFPLSQLGGVHQGSPVDASVPVAHQPVPVPEEKAIEEKPVPQKRA